VKTGKFPMRRKLPRQVDSWKVEVPAVLTRYSPGGTSLSASCAALVVVDQPVVRNVPDYSRYPRSSATPGIKYPLLAYKVTLSLGSDRGVALL
jgi:hypothetical protein